MKSLETSPRNEPFSEIDIEEAMEHARERAQKAKHVWRQRGVWLVCTSCEQEHAVWIGTGKKLVGINDDGSPKFAV